MRRVPPRKDEAPETDPLINKALSRLRGEKDAKGLDLMTVLSWAHEAFAVVLSIFDIVSDFLVAYEFYAAGHLYWCKAVLVAMFLSNCLYTIFGVEFVLRGRVLKSGAYKIGTLHERGRLVQYPAVFLMGQLMPFVSWLNQTLNDKTSAKKSTTAVLGQENSPNAAAGDELRQAAESAAVWSRFSDAWAGHLQRHAGFYIETLFEALPQCVIQLLAATSTGEITALQLVSMAISVISVTSKAYVFSQSFEVRAFAFKFLVACLDVLSFFYFFSTLMSSEEASAGEPMSLPLIGGWLPEIRATFLTRIVVYKIYVVGMFTYFAANLFIALGTADDYANGHLRRDSAGIILLIFGVVQISLLPILVCVELIKVSIVTIAIAAFVQGKPEGFVLHGTILSFTRNVKNLRPIAFEEDETNETKQQQGWVPRKIQSYFESFDYEYDRRVRFLQRQLTARVMDVHTNKDILRELDISKGEFMKLQQQIHEVSKSGRGNYFHGLWWTRQLLMSRAEWMQVKFGVRCVLQRLDSFFTSRRRSGGVDIALPFSRIMSPIMATLFFGGALLTAPYAMLHGFFTVGWDNMNPFQQFFFAGCLLVMLPMIPLYPAARRYFVHCFTFEFWNHAERSELLRKLREALGKFHLPSCEDVVLHCVPRELIPGDVCGEIGAFLTPRDVSVPTLSLKECETIRDEAEEFGIRHDSSVLFEVSHEEDYGLL